MKTIAVLEQEQDLLQERMLELKDMVSEMQENNGDGGKGATGDQERILQLEGDVARLTEELEVAKEE